MGQIALFFAVLCSALLCAETQFNIGRKIQFRKLAMCPRNKNATFRLDRTRFTRDERGATTAISFRIVVTKEIKKLAIIVAFLKCDDSGNADNCEFYLKNYNASNICELMAKENQVWSLWMETVTLPKHCPIGVGTYYSNNTPITGYQLNFLPIPNAFWKIKLEGYDQDGLYIACVDVEFLVYMGRGTPHP